MTTLRASSTSAAIPLDAWGKITVSANNGGGTLSFISDAKNLCSDFTANLQSKTYGPFGAPGTVTLSVTSGSISYTTSLAAGNGSSVAYDPSTGYITANGNSLSAPRIQKLRRAFAAARAFNPIDAPIATDQPTLGTVNDASLTYTSCDPAAASTAAKMNLLGGVWTKDGANNRWGVITDNVTSGAHAGTNIVEFWSDSAKVEIKVAGGPLYVEVDGYAITKASTGVPVGGTGGSGSVLATIDYTGTTGAIPRRYRVWVAGINYVYSIGITSGCRLWAPERDDIVRLGIDGDSYIAKTVGDGTTALDNLGMAGVAALQLGIRDLWNFSEGGTGYTNPGTKTTYPQRASAITGANAIGNGLDIGVVWGSINDSTQSAAVVAAAALAYYQTLRAATPGVPWVIFGAQAGTTGPSAALLAVETGISQAVAAMADPLMVFVPVSSETLPWIDSTNSATYIGADNVHPNLAGHLYHGKRMAQGIRWALSQMPGIA